MVSTRDLTPLPSIDELRRRMQQMTVLESILSVLIGIESLTFSFHPSWGQHQQVGCFDNGCGDELYVHFVKSGCLIIGFDHESMMTPYRVNPPVLWPGLLESVPQEFQSSLNEPAFDIPATTFFIWRLDDASKWTSSDVEFPGNDNVDYDGSSHLLAELLRDAAEFADWLEENFETDIDRRIVERVFQGAPLSNADLISLCPSAKLSTLRALVTSAGYPLSNEKTS